MKTEQINELWLMLRDLKDESVRLANKITLAMKIIEDASLENLK